MVGHDNGNIFKAICEALTENKDMQNYVVLIINSKFQETVF
ncbi:DNA (cytosine-5-)-methyltransferase [Streptococcus anginosus]|jgi:hypothetical protein|nr:DNA (cytosine-5-)-methyltransferase [Streptococcus anginosus]